MSSITQIFNFALTELGDDRAMAPDDDRAKTLNLRYENMRDAVLRDHPWNFAITRAQLAKDTDAPAFGFGSQYTLPNKPYCLRVLWVAHDDAVWDVEGRKILTDEGSPLNVRYIARIIDTEQFDPLFTEALAARLAEAIVMKQVDSRGFKKQLWDHYLLKLANARRADGQEGTPADIRAESLLESRF